MNLLLLLLLVALILLFAYLIWGLILARKHALQFTKILPWSPADSAVYLTANVTPVMQDYGYRLDNQGVAAVVFSNTYRPAWLALPCVLLFPIGLLALLHRKTVDVAFNIVPAETGCTVHVSGEASKSFWAELRASLETLRPADADVAGVEA